VRITTTSLPPATIGVPYLATVTAAGGTPPYTFFVGPQINIIDCSGGVCRTVPGPPPLPRGLKLLSNGTLRGTPTGPAGTYTVGINVLDSSKPNSFGFARLTILVQ
jgi:hypothetical protein